MVGFVRGAQKASLRPAEAVVVVGLTTVSPVKGQAEGARGQQVLGTPTPEGPLVPQTIPGTSAPLGPHWALVVHPGTAPAAGNVSENTASYDLPSTAAMHTVLPSLPWSVRGTPADTGQRAGVLPTKAFVHVVA